MNRFTLCAALLALIAPCVVTAAADPAAAPPTEFAALDADFAKWMTEAHVPGLVWGIVKNGRLIHIRAMGVQDRETRTPVSANTAFRIASMTKAFTGYSILKLRDEGRLRLSDRVSKYVPETKGWAQAITIADLLHHTAGFVTDDPWGDRQQPLPEAAFTKMLKTGVPFSSAPGTRYEYSNFGYATLGRIVTNVAKQDYAKRVEATVLKPLGMAATRYEVRDVPAARLAMGYRWENNAFAPEPVMPHGAFGAMGGLVTTGNDYAKWIGHLLSAWPAQDGEPQSAKTIRAMQYGGGLLHMRRRPGKEGDACRLSAIYGAGLVAANDCVLGNVLFHGGGFPGYGSHMLLLPDAGVGLFALTNRTYAGPTAPVWDAATTLLRSGYIAPRPLPATPALNTGYAAARRIWAKGGVEGEGEGGARGLAMNFAMDRNDANWRSHLAGLSERLGACDDSPPVIATGNLAGRFVWACAKGRLEGSILMAPTAEPQIQALTMQAAFNP